MRRYMYLYTTWTGTDLVLVLSVPTDSDGGCNDGLGWDGHWVNCCSGPRHHCVEAVVVISRIVDGSDGAISLVQGVRTLDYVTVSDFLLRLGISGASVADPVVELVLGVRLGGRKLPLIWMLRCLSKRRDVLRQGSWCWSRVCCT